MSNPKVREGKKSRPSRRNSVSLGPPPDLKHVAKLKYRSNTVIEKPEFIEDDLISSGTKSYNLSSKYKRRDELDESLFRKSTNNLTVPGKKKRRSKASMDFHKIAKLFKEPKSCFTIEEFLEGVFIHLDFKDLIACSRVCKHWNAVCKSKRVWLAQYNKYETLLLKDSKENNVNIWESVNYNASYELPLDKKQKWTTLNDLVLRLTPYKSIPEQFETETLLNTYSSFTTTDHLVRKLWERYNVPEPNDMPKEEFADWNKQVRVPIQARTCFILKSLIHMKYKEFSPDMIRMLKIIAMLLDNTLAKVIKNQISKEQQSCAQPIRELEGVPCSVKVPGKKRISSISHGYFGKKNKVLIYNFEEIARELTLCEFSTYKDIQTSELMNQSWSKSQKDLTSPNIRKMIERFNYTTRAITTSILNEEKPKNRARVFTQWIKIARSLRELHNYQTLMAVIMGLNDAPIHRLKITKSLIKPKYLEILDSLNNLMSMEGSYSNYRKALQTAKSPCIPYIGIYLRDLTYIESTPQKVNKDGKEGIMFNQNLRVYGVIHFLKTYQSVAYPFESIPELEALLSSIPLLSEEECRTVSRKLEPGK